MKTVAAPPFAESVSEGDVRWEKGEFTPGPVPVPGSAWGVLCLATQSAYQHVMYHQLKPRVTHSLWSSLSDC